MPASTPSAVSPLAGPQRGVGHLWQGLKDRIGAACDRAGLHPGLVAFATRFPLSRPIARARAGAVFDLCAGFVYSQVLVAAVRLGLFEALRAGPRTTADLAGALRLPEAGARRLLEAAASLRLAARAGRDRYRLGPLGRAVLLDPGITAMVEHHAMLYRDLADPVALLRGERGERALGAFWSYSEAEDASGHGRERTLAYTRLMSASQAMVSREVVRAYPFACHRRMVDVAGGDGTFLQAVAAAAPALDLTLFDLPSVAAEAESRFARGGLAGRARAVGGDFRRDPVPAGADLVSLVRVLHDHEDETVRALLASVRRALPPGGTLLVAEPLADTAGAERVGGAYFGFYLMAMGQGRARSYDELALMLREAGFVDVERRPTSLPIVTGVIVAHTPAGGGV
ncbi:acetylserotonin O-methyltransferase [Lichenibacterium dinghuense]|uniref:acetylserotonin O-methyltransferase n=1 Tax=Lichenibacterium dinghuense TaxID=2895977 RepID=UPI001F40C8C2|nr:acetylserotonin O-methyltransferase [Lichenibacterium sp. 6Y81]